jgi:hypothetical protein
MNMHYEKQSLVIGLLLGLSGCSGGPPQESTPNLTGMDNPTAVNGTLLLEQKLNDSTIAYYALQDGATAVQEIAPTGASATESLGGAKPKSLAEAYRAFNPGATEVPSILLEADTRAQAAAGISMAGPHPAFEQKPGLQQSDDGYMSKSCSGDLLQDTYGAQWFLNNYCNGGNYLYCGTMWNGTHWSNIWASWAHWTVMAGDFNVGTVSSGGHYSNGNKVQDFVHPIQPRTIWTWTYTSYGGYYFDEAENEDCRHTHWAVGWNS